MSDKFELIKANLECLASDVKLMRLAYYNNIIRYLDEVEKENAALEEQIEDTEYCDTNTCPFVRDVENLKKENNMLNEQKEYLKKQGDELAITVSNLVIETKALKEQIEEKDLELKALFENEHQTEINGGNERIIAELKKQIVQYDAANAKLRAENEKLGNLVHLSYEILNEEEKEAGK